MLQLRNPLTTCPDRIHRIRPHLLCAGVYRNVAIGCQLPATKTAGTERLHRGVPIPDQVRDCFPPQRGGRTDATLHRERPGSGATGDRRIGARARAGRTVPARSGPESLVQVREIAYWRNLDLSLPVDGVANFTRTPEVWFWLLHHYRSEQQLSPGVFGLRRDDSRASRISMQSQPLGLTAQTYPITERSSTIDLGAPNWPANADFSAAAPHRALWRSMEAAQAGAHAGGNYARQRQPDTCNGSYCLRMSRRKSGFIRGVHRTWFITLKPTKAVGAPVHALP